MELHWPLRSLSNVDINNYFINSDRSSLDRHYRNTRQCRGFNFMDPYKKSFGPQGVTVYDWRPQSWADEVHENRIHRHGGVWVRCYTGLYACQHGILPALIHWFTYYYLYEWGQQGFWNHCVRYATVRVSSPIHAIRYIRMWRRYDLVKKHAHRAIYANIIS